MTKEKLTIILMGFILKFSIELIYIIYIHPLFEYTGFYLSINPYKWIFSNIIMLFFLLIIRARRSFTSLFLYTLLIFMILPLLSIYSLKDLPTLYTVYYTIGFSTVISISQYIRINVPNFKINKNFIYVFLIMPILVLIFYFLNEGLPGLSALSFEEVYVLRGNANENFFITYLRPWSAKVIIPFFFGYFLYTKKFKLASFIFFLQILIFLYTGHKSYIFSLILLGIILIIARNGHLIAKFLKSITAVIIFVLFLVLLNLDTTLATLLVRRSFFIPAQNSYYYFEYFSMNERMNLSHSIFSSFLDNSYLESIPLVIGLTYYGSLDMYVNTGFIGDAYMNFAFIGIVIFSVILGLLLLFISNLKKPLEIKLSALFIAMFSLINGALLTSLMTGGILLGILLLVISQPKFKG